MLQRMFRAMKLDASVFEEVEHDPSALTQALGCVVIASLLWSSWSILVNGPMGLISAVLSALLGWAVWSTITYLVGTKVFGGTADLGEMLRALGFAYAPMALGIVPILGHIVGFILMVIAGVIAVRQALDFTTGKAIGTVAVGVVAWIVLWIVFAMIGAMLGGGGA